MKIFITGATGFIGKHVMNKLQSEDLLILLQGNKISNLSKKVKVIKGSLNNIKKWQNQVKRFKPDAAIHLAWEGIPDYSIEMSIKNLNQGLDLYKFLSSIKCQTILTAGSCWEYGKQQGKIPEDTLPKPFNAFTAAKNSLCVLGNEIAKGVGINFIWTRLFYVYGPGQRSESLIPYLIDCVKNEKIPKIKNPDADNDFVYVEDVAEAISRIITRYKKSGIFNIGSGKLTSIQHIIDIIFDYSDRKKQIKKSATKQVDSLLSFYADLSKIKQEIGWEPKVGIADGIKKTIDYFSK